MIDSYGAVLSAFDEGRVHTQSFLKNNGTFGDLHWQDWAMSSGKPAYDARIGQSGAFNPVVAQGNDALYFPGIGTGMERRLAMITLNPRASNSAQATVQFYLYDLVGTYPLIDGDSTDPQDFDNTRTLPRYADGEGLRLVLVNHVAPAVQNGGQACVMIDYRKRTAHHIGQHIGVKLTQQHLNTAC